MGLMLHFIEIVKQIINITRTALTFELTTHDLITLNKIIIVYIYIAHNNQKDSLCALHKFHTTTLKRDMF